MSIEPFLVSTVTPNLYPGERILGCAMLRRPRKINPFGVPQEYENYLGVATDRRLILFETDVGGLLTPTAKPVARNAIVWNYDELSRIELDVVQGAVVHSGGRGRVLFLAPIPGHGPFAAQTLDEHEITMSARRYDVYAQIDNIPGQAQFMDQLVPWLHAQFQAGAFAASPERRQEFDARIRNLEAQRAAEAQRRAAANAAALKAASKWGPRIAIGGVAALMVIGGLALAGNGANDTMKRGRQLAFFDERIAQEDADLTWSRGKSPMPPGCPDEETSILRTCHGCSRDAYPRDGWKQVKRGSETFQCPPPSDREMELTANRMLRDNAASDRTLALASIAGGLVLAIIGALAGFLGLRWLGRRAA